MAVDIARFHNDHKSVYQAKRVSADSLSLVTFSENPINNIPSGNMMTYPSDTIYIIYGGESIIGQ